jgi:Phage integrase, N-terminal SAM-like domain
LTYKKSTRTGTSIHAGATRQVALQLGNDRITVPAIIAELGDDAAKRFLEIFTANIRNKNARAAYARAVAQFLRWCDGSGIALKDVEPIHVAGYVELLQQRLADPSVKQHLAAIRTLFDWLVVGQVVKQSPAASVRGPKHVLKNGNTPVLSATDARKLLDTIPAKIGPDPEEGQDDQRPPSLIGLRDRALIATMAFISLDLGLDWLNVPEFVLYLALSENERRRPIVGVYAPRCQWAITRIRQERIQDDSSPGKHPARACCYRISLPSEGINEALGSCQDRPPPRRAGGTFHSAWASLG